MSDPSEAILSDAQIAALAAVGDERTAEAGEVLFHAGDVRYPLIAIVKGEVAVLDAFGEQISRHSSKGFLGEVDLLSGQAVFVTAVATKPLRYVAVERARLLALMNDDASLSDVLVATFVRRREALQQVAGAGIEVIGPRDSEQTRQTLTFVRQARIAFTWRDPAHDEDSASLVSHLEADEIPLIRFPGGRELRQPTNGELSRALGIGLELRPHEEVDLLIVGAGPAGLGAAVYGASEGLDTLVVERTSLGGQAGASRRIENYLGFPAGVSGTELTSRAITQARKFSARTATPYRALAVEPGEGRHVVRLEDERTVAARAVLIATGADYRRLPVAGLERYEGMSVLYEAGPPEAQQSAGRRVVVVGGGNSAAQAAVWLARGGAFVTLVHRRADVRETMSDYLVTELQRFGVAVRDRSEIAGLHGTGAELEAVTLSGGERLAVSYLFVFLGADPCTGWLAEAVARDADGFILTGAAVGSADPLETSVPGIFAAGDVRAGSFKRVATAIGEGGAVVQSVHRFLARAPG